MTGENTLNVSVATATTATTTPKRRGRPPKADKVVSPTKGWGRGWHLKKSYTAPDGSVYAFGKPV